jgi:glycosyltransferase involved in cell wall biosynthesis
MRILLLQDAEWRKKGPHQQHHLMELLSIRGHEILVIGFDQLWREERSSIYSKRSDVPDVNRFYDRASVSYIQPGFIKLPILDYLSFLLSSRREISNQVRSFDPDVIIGFSSILSNYWGLHFAKRMGIPYVYYCYDNPSALNVPKPFMPLAEFIVNNIMKKSDRVLTINKALNDYVIRLGANPATTQVVPQGVDFKRFDISKADRINTRRRYNISDDEILLFFMGWLYTFSGLKEVIMDIHKYNDDDKKIKLMIVGYGDDFDNLNDKINRYDLHDRVILAGKKGYEEIPDLISAADICLLPSHNDAVIRDIVPIKMYEYLAMHKPIISTKLPGVMKEFGMDSGVIYVDTPGEVIEKVVDLQEREIELQSRNAEKFIKDYDWNTIISNFEMILQSLNRGVP